MASARCSCWFRSAWSDSLLFSGRCRRFTAPRESSAHASNATLSLVEGGCRQSWHVEALASRHNCVGVVQLATQPRPGTIRERTTRFQNGDSDWTDGGVYGPQGHAHVDGMVRSQLPCCSLLLAAALVAPKSTNDPLVCTGPWYDCRLSQERADRIGASEIETGWHAEAHLGGLCSGHWYGLSVTAPCANTNRIAFKPPSSPRCPKLCLLCSVHPGETLGIMGPSGSGKVRACVHACMRAPRD